MRKAFLLLLFLLISIPLLTAYSSSKSDEPARAMEAGRQALLAHGSARLSRL
jgi:hypothetical protein